MRNELLLNYNTMETLLIESETENKVPETVNAKPVSNNNSSDNSKSSDELEAYREKWKFLTTDSETRVALALLETFKSGNMEELSVALQANYEGSIASAKHELWEHLKDLIESVILVQLAPEFRTPEHWEKICRLRTDVEDDLEWNDCLTEKNIYEEWPDAFRSAKDIAEIYAPKAANLESISWDDVFETSFHPDNYGE